MIRLYYCKFFMVMSLSIAASTLHVHAQLAKDKCKFLGNITAGFVPSDFNSYWNQVTPENGGKWGTVEGTRNTMQWGQLDLAYNHAKTNGFPFKQHTFVWGQQQPAWINALSAAEQRQEVEEWIKSYCERYPETDYIDVVNEPLHAVPDYAVALGGGGITGWDWVVWSFEKARQYCPNAKLALNDYNIINNNAATDNYLAIINILKQRSLIDVIGEQGHFLETTPLNTLKQNLDKLHATGLPIHISEYDVNLDEGPQRDKYMEQFPTLWTHPGVQGITLWGYREGQIWRTNAYLVRSNETPRPALTWLTNYMQTAPGGFFCLPPVGVEEEQSGIEVYPTRPVDGKFTVIVDDGTSKVTVLDMQGRIRRELTVSGGEPAELQLDAAGLYILKIYDGRRTTYRRVILN